MKPILPAALVAAFFVAGCANTGGQPGNPPAAPHPIIGTLLDSANNTAVFYARLKRCGRLYELLSKIDAAAAEGLLTKFEQDVSAPAMRDRGVALCGTTEPIADEALLLEVQIELADQLVTTTNKRRRKRAG